MRDAQWIFGLITAAVKTTQVYSADVIKLGDIDAKSPFYKGAATGNHQTGKVEGLEAVFVLTSALVAADTVIPILQDSADNSSWAEIVRGPITTAAMGIGERLRLPVPIEHKKYLRASVYPNSSGTLTETTLVAWIEGGPN